MYIIHMYTVRRTIQDTTHSSLCSVQYDNQYIMYSVQCTAYSIRRTVSRPPIHSAHHVQRIIQYLQYTLYSVHRTMYGVYICTVYCTIRCTVHYTLFTLYCTAYGTLYRVYSTAYIMYPSSFYILYTVSLYKLYIVNCVHCPQSMYVL